MVLKILAILLSCVQAEGEHSSAQVGVLEATYIPHPSEIVFHSDGFHLIEQ